ncbi:hypothetical protein B0H34DRAFT_162748 [Crassisporium funariophilum]|nr:hypothetical protein B0H34DRAFT_162748 [Crassisporium funariophilum]
MPNRDALLHSITSLELRRSQLLQEIDSVSLELMSEKAKYARSINEDALVYRLPNELLTGIFMACQQYRRTSTKSTPPPPFQVVASHVSHRWRHIVLSTPLLWNDIAFSIRPMGHVQGRILAQLEAHLTRSDTCFLDITLNFHVIGNLSSYFRLISAYSTRWRRLSIVTRYEQVEDIYDLLHSASTPILEHLSLNLGKPQEGSLSPRKQYSSVLPTVFNSGAPRLSFVRLAGLAMGSLHPPTSAVTTLHLDGWTRNYLTHVQFKTVLEAAPLLVNLSLNQLCIHHPRDPLEVASPATLPNLRCLRIRGPCSPLYRLISLMNIPQLHSLSLHNVDTFDSDTLPSVQSLSLDSCAFDEPELGNLIRSFPSINSLSVDESMPDIFYMLIPNLADELPMPWPHLQTISVRELNSMDIPHFCSMVFSRQDNDKALSKVYLDRRSRAVLRAKHRLDWLLDRLKVENCDLPETWPPGLGYEDPHDLLE